MMADDQVGKIKIWHALWDLLSTLLKKGANIPKISDTTNKLIWAFTNQ